MKKIGLIINPWAGVGGPAGLKGSDGSHTVEQALARGATQRAGARMKTALESLLPFSADIQFVSFAGEMGQALLESMGFRVEVIGRSAAETSCAEDTEKAARVIRDHGVDLLLFAGGDGTARNIYNAIGDDFPVLGIPAGVKMHSGCYAITPAAGGEVLRRLMSGELVDLRSQEVRDIDEQAFRAGKVRTRFYGELLVPEAGQFVQAVKNAGREVEALAVADIAAEIVENMEEDTLYIVGPGSTTFAVMEELGLDGTLLGVDLVRGGELLAADVSAAEIVAQLSEQVGPVKIIVTGIGGQGHVLGRGNQQISPEVLRTVGRDNIIVVATKTKVSELQGRPLLLDSGDAQLDEDWSGFIPVITGYRDSILYPVSDGRTGYVQVPEA
ncbi:ATP-NAD kinase family protein [Biformimicrobium ophioploci]|uniref:ATP-NAD kinase family protein n=1 Tax=Biformimicrobium ophioploci TaxID=3036711 RepID=A0ABQ6LY81_9GAMM|nr:ATP-NAD kinase family protein [Microbulbifer sp. NKW57]GMG87007.1 ATP-NAD kinase family protein [Microbulbifer sp. NKW57]